MTKIMHTVGDIASNAIKYRSVVELIKDSGYLDEEMEEKLGAAVSITEKAQYLGEIASLLEKLGLIREGDTISRVALSGIGVTKAAGLVGGTVGVTGATAALSGASGTIATCVAGGALTAAAAPIVAGVAVAGAVGWGISKLCSSIWD